MHIRTALALPRWPTPVKPFPRNLMKFELTHVVPDDDDGPLDAERRTLERLTEEWTRELESAAARLDLSAEGKRQHLKVQLPKFEAALADLQRRLEAKRGELRDRQERMRQPKRSARAEVSATAELIEELRRQEIRGSLMALDRIRRHDSVRSAVVGGDLELCNAVLDAPRVHGDLVEPSMLRAVQSAVYPEHADAVQALEERIPLFELAMREVVSWLSASADFDAEQLRAVGQVAERNARVRVSGSGEPAPARI